VLLDCCANRRGFDGFFPPAALEVFNLNLSHDRLAVSATRFAAFEAALKVASMEEADGIFCYVGTVNADQRSLLVAGRDV
jgi:hypothetical protein